MIIAATTQHKEGRKEKVNSVAKNSHDTGTTNRRGEKREDFILAGGTDRVCVSAAPSFP